MDDDAERQRVRNRLAMDWHEFGAAERALGDADAALGDFLVSLGEGGQMPIRVGLAHMFASRRDQRLALDGHFDRLERETMKNEQEE